MSGAKASNGYRSARCRSRLAALAATALVAVPRVAMAEDSPYCRRVRARVAEESALLMWPTLYAQGTRLPSSSGELGPTFGNNFQVRVGLSFSPTNVLKATHFSHVAEIDCELQASLQALHDRVVEGASAAALPAVRAQVDYLEGHRGQLRQILSRADQQRAAGIATAMEVQELRQSVVALERKLEALRGEKERIEAQAPMPSAPPTSVLAATVARRSVELERESSRAGIFNALRVNLAGGAIPDFIEGSASWFALVEVSYSLGGLVGMKEAQRRHEARAEEVQQARYELPSQAAQLQRDLHARLRQARRELEVVESELASVKKLRAALAQSPSASADQARARLVVEEIWNESDRIYLQGLVEALAPLAEEPDAGG